MTADWRLALKAQVEHAARERLRSGKQNVRQAGFGFLGVGVSRYG
jgi:hypothetical protein